MSRNYIGPLRTDAVNLASSIGPVAGAVWPVGCIDAVTLYFQATTAAGSAAWPTSLVMEIRAGLSPDDLVSWPGGAIILNSTTYGSLPYLSQELRVTALPFVGFVITTIATSTWSGFFGIYGEASS